MSEYKIITAPIELNFLLFVKKIFDKTWVTDISYENFYQDFEDRLEGLWNKRVDSLFTKKSYVLNESFVEEDIKELVANEKIGETVVNEFKNLWGWESLPPHGYGSLIERISGSLKSEQINRIVGADTIHIMITFDAIPAGYKREIPEDKLKIHPYMEFLRYV